MCLLYFVKTVNIFEIMHLTGFDFDLGKIRRYKNRNGSGQVYCFCVITQIFIFKS